MVEVYAASKELPQLPDRVVKEDFVLQSFGLLSNILCSLYIDGPDGEEIRYTEEAHPAHGFSESFINQLFSISLLAEEYTRELYVSSRKSTTDEEVYRRAIGARAMGWGNVFEC